MGGLARLFLEAHAEELGLAPGLDLDLRHELALGLLAGEPRDGLELAALLLERRAEPGLLVPEAPLALAQAPLAILEVGVAPVELIQPAADLLLLLRDAPLQLLQLPLADAGFLVQLGARLQRHLLGLELDAADLGLGVAGPGLGLAHLALGVPARLLGQPLGVVHDAAGAALRVGERAGRDGAGSEMSSEISSDGGEESDDRHHHHQPGHGVHRSLHPGS